MKAPAQLDYRAIVEVAIVLAEWETFRGSMKSKSAEQ